MTGIRRCGKSVMLELIKQELIESGINPAQFISINFEDMNYAHLQTAKALHDEITKRAADLDGRYVEFIIYPFSFAEFIELYKTVASDETIQKCFQKYLLTGSMPYLANQSYFRKYCILGTSSPWI